MNKISIGIDRRDLLKASALAMGATLLAESAEAYPKAVNTNSSPSTLNTARSPSMVTSIIGHFRTSDATGGSTIAC